MATGGNSIIRAWKLQEFVAHSANVNCLALGHMSGRVLVTGGDDKKVNLWAVGKPNCIMSLSGHTTPVECVRFGHTEELVCAGSQLGALKIWDLEAAKIVRTLTGHKASIRCVDFHPYGDFLASGSLDTNIKLWDIRRKGCIFTYKGHALTVNSLKFSPDGQWIASAGEDGKVKLWDLRAGKLLTEFSNHTGPVMDVQFHPHEFLLASGSSDRTVNYWDLESLQLVSATDGDCTAVRCISFSPGGEVLFSGCQNMMKVYGWEPPKTHDSLELNWGRVQDIATSKNQLIGASFNQTNVTVFVVDLKKVYPLGGQPNQTIANDVSPFKHGQSGRRSFIKENTNGTKAQVNMKTVEESDKSGTDPEDDLSSAVDIKVPVDYQNVFHPRKDHPLTPQILMSPSADISLSSLTSPVKSLSPEPTTHMPLSPVRRASVSQCSVSKVTKSPPSVVRQNSMDNVPQKQAAESVHIPEPDCSNGVMRSPSEPALNRLEPNHTRSSSLTRTAVNINGRTDVKPILDNRVKQSKVVPVRGLPEKLMEKPRPMEKPRLPIVNRPPQQRLVETKPVQEQRSEKPMELRSDFVPIIPDKPANLDLDEFLPKHFKSSLGMDSNGIKMTEEELFNYVARDRESVMKVLTMRQRSIQVIHNLWVTKDVKTAVERAVDSNDLAVIVDILGVLVLRPSIWNLDLCVALLHPILDLLGSKYEVYMTAGCNTLRLILKNFTSLIRTNIQSPIQTVGVDISREERYNKCLKCYNHLMGIRAFLLKRQTLQGKLGHTFRELLILMEPLD